MKVKKIIDICKGTGRICLYDGKDEQWIGNGVACYPLYGMPKLNKETLCSTYDIAEAQAEKIHFQHDKGLPDFIKNCENKTFDLQPNEYHVSLMELRLISDGKTLVPVALQDESVAYFDEKYLQPFSDVDSDILNIYEYPFDKKRMCFVVMAGMITVGLIMAYDVIKERFVNTLGEMYLRSKRQLAFMRSKEVDGQQKL